MTHDSRTRPGGRATSGSVVRVGAKGYVSHMGTLLGSAIASEDFVAIHMTWGAVNELTTLTAYHRMIAKTDNVALTQVLRAIIKQERRHFAFYRAQARMRLGDSQRARRLVRWTMDRLWAPVGTGIRPQEETDFVVAYLFNDPDGAVALKEMDGNDRRAPRPRGNALPLRGGRAQRRAAGEPVRGLTARLAAGREGGPSCPRACP